MDGNLEQVIIDVTEDLWWVFYLEQEPVWEAVHPILDQFTLLGLRPVSVVVDDPYFRVLLQDERNNTFFELSSPSDESAPFVFLGAAANDFLPPESPSARVHADRFLEYGKVCYHTLRPLYAFAENLNAFVERDDVVVPRLTHMFWAQFLGPAFVRGVGQTMLLNAPAWRNENLGDGGLLYVLAASPYLYRGPRQYWEQARDYFSHYNLTPLSWSDRQG